MLTPMLLPRKPDTGGRFSLVLRAEIADGARYDLTLTLPAAEWSTEASVAIADGAVGCGTWRGEGEPHGWLLQYARSALRSAWQAHREQGWPRRLTRWRDVPARAAAREGGDD
jgi:hypothetical protein